MHDLLHDDPAFRPPKLRSSFGTEINNNETPSSSAVSEASVEESSPPTKRRRQDDMMEYLKESDDRFLTVVKEMQDSQNKLMEKLIEKLG